MNGMLRWSKDFGNTDVFSLTYIGAAGRQLMRHDIYNAPNPTSLPVSSTYSVMERIPAITRFRSSIGIG